MWTRLTLLKVISHSHHCWTLFFRCAEIRNSIEQNACNVHASNSPPTYGTLQMCFDSMMIWFDASTSLKIPQAVVERQSIASEVTNWWQSATVINSTMVVVDPTFNSMVSISSNVNGCYGTCLDKRGPPWHVLHKMDSRRQRNVCVRGIDGINC